MQYKYPTIVLINGHLFFVFLHIFTIREFCRDMSATFKILFLLLKKLPVKFAYLQVVFYLRHCYYLYISCGDFLKTMKIVSLTNA